MTNDFPRRMCVEKMTTAERSIGEAIAEVERMGAHPLLTDAVVLLGQAQTKVADYVDAPFTRLRAEVIGEESKFVVNVIDDLGRDQCKLFVRQSNNSERFAKAIANCINTSGLVIEQPR